MLASVSNGAGDGLVIVENCCSLSVNAVRRRVLRLGFCPNCFSFYANISVSYRLHLNAIVKANVTHDRGACGSFVKDQTASSGSGAPLARPARV